MLVTRISSRSARNALQTAPSIATQLGKRWQSTLDQNPHIYVYPQPNARQGTNLLTFLPTNPPTPELAIASTTALPPTPASVTENPNFMTILQTVISRHAIHDPDVQAQAQAFASSGGSSLGSGGMFFPGQQQQQKQRQRQSVRRGQRTNPAGGGGGGGAGGDGAGGASSQGGAGGGGVGGFVHVSDQRNPPDWGRIAYPEDILGSVQVDGSGRFVGERGGYQASGTYRFITREGILNLSPYLRERLLEELENAERAILQKPRN